MKKWMVPLILLGLLFGAWYVSTLKTPPSRPPESPPESPPPTDLRAQLEKIEKETEQAVRTYAPKKLDRIDNLSISVEPIIKSLPGVEKVIVTGAKNPTKRIIHIVDWHFVDKDDYRIDMEHAHAKKLTDAEFDEMYRELLLVVEMVQAEQMGLIRCLRHHGLRAVFSEGYSVGEEKEFGERIEAVRGIQKQSEEMRGQLADVRAILKEASGERKNKTEDLEKEIMYAAEGLKAPLLEIGAAGRLLLLGDLEKVLPMEDEKRHQEAKLVQGGKITVDAGKIGKRRAAIVGNVLASGPVAVIVLGGSHDLREHLPKDAEYIRVYVKSYPK